MIIRVSPAQTYVISANNSPFSVIWNLPFGFPASCWMSIQCSRMLNGWWIKLITTQINVKSLLYRNRVWTTAQRLRSAAIRSSSGGWVMNKAFMPLLLPLLIPNAFKLSGIWSGIPISRFNVCRAPIISSLLVS